MTLKSGWVVYNGYVTLDRIKDLAYWLRDSAVAKGLDVKVVKHNELVPMIENGKCVLKGIYADERPDFVIFWDKDIRLAKHLEKMGMRLYNSSEAIRICDDKTATYNLLADEGIKTPNTIVSPLVFPRSRISWDSFYEGVEKVLGYPMVVKEAFGSFGFEVYLVNNREELKEKSYELQHKPHMYQEFIKSSIGKDIRLNVVGGEVVASMMRKSETDFRANITNGGSSFKYEPTERQKEVAIKCAELLGADFAGVDLMFGEDEEPILCEVNSNAHMRSIQECTGIDVPSKIIDYIINDMG